MPICLLRFVPFAAHEFEPSEFDNRLEDNDGRYENDEPNWQKDVNDRPPTVIEIMFKGKPGIRLVCIPNLL